VRKYKFNLNNATTLKFDLLYKIIIKIIKNNIVIQEININNNSTIQQVINIDINNLINIINKKHKLTKKVITFRIMFSFLTLLAIAISNSKINKTLNILTRIFEKFKINNAQNIIETEVYQII